MKKLLSLIMVLAFIPMFLTTGCKKEEEKSDYDVLTEYIKANNLDLSAITTGLVVGGSGININKTDYSVADYYVMDVRAAADFDAGHIKDAHNVALTGIIEEAAKANGKKILCVCYTGQTAARAAALLRMAGFTAYSLKWGMSSWHSNFASKWNSGAKDVTSTNWLTTGDAPALVEYSDPTITSDKATGKEILDERIKAVLSLAWTESSTNVLADPSKYFINNYWPKTSWDAYGHISGASRIYDELNVDGLKYLDPSDDIVTYCYTGQTSAQVTAWLNVLGFEKAKSLSFGTNGIIYTNLKNGTVDSAPAKSWKGTGSGSENNFGFYKTDGTYVQPL
jgi:rhodanese-related sulfurtransferase